MIPYHVHMLASALKTTLVAAGVSGAVVSAQPPEQNAWLRSLAAMVSSPQQQYGASSSAVAGTIENWKRLQQSDSYPFSDYATFLLAHPGWPGENTRRAAAEASLGSGSDSPSLALRYFERFPPLTGAGRLRFAEALLVTGQRDKANEQARLAWRSGVLRPGDETQLLGMFPGALRPEDHDARMDRLLWEGATSAAARQIGFVSPGMRGLFEARLAFRTNAPDAAAKGAAASESARAHPGFIADRATWLRNSMQSGAARAYLAQPRSLSALPADVEEWFEVLLVNARGAANDRQWSLAYAIARQVDDAYPQGTDVSDRPYGERDEYTSLVWLAGQAAMHKLGRPADAIGMFARYAGGSRTPQTRSKGLYWAGRAAEAAGQAAVAQDYYRRAAGYGDLFYGQLAAERTRQPLRRPPEFDGSRADPAARQAFFAREVVRAAQVLGTLGRWTDQTLFLRQIANDAKTDADHVFAVELSRAIGRPDLAVMVGRSALQNGLSDYTAAGFPTVRVPSNQVGYWTMIHAIARQESQFDRAAVSHAGARGLMQLMPGTARETAGKIGLGYNLASLISDPDYNIQLGSTYFQRMLDYYGGSYPLAVAAYNAGPGNVNRWLAANGDPRTRSIDIVDWIEAIPIFETKNYVQRVLENAVVYDLMHPERARSRGPANLSWYLGKSQPG